MKETKLLRDNEFDMINFIKSEFNKYEWGIEYDIKQENELWFNITFPKCLITFFLNNKYNSVDCKIYDIRSKDDNYYLWQALESNNKKRSDLFYEFSEVGQNEYITQYIKIINERLMNVVNGDYKWADTLKRIEINATKIRKVMGTSFIVDTEIYKKMIKGDENWESDLEKLNK